MSVVASSVRSESPRQYFRRHLLQQTSSARDLLWYLEESVPRFAGSAEVRLAVEELVDRLGEFLCFTVERAEGHDYAIWRSPRGARLVVSVETATRAVARMAPITQTRARLLTSVDVVREDDLSCLCVLAGAVDERLVNDAVALRRLSREVRLVSTTALTALAMSLEAGRLSHADAVTLLRPSSALADGAIAIAGGPALTRP